MALRFTVRGPGGQVAHATWDGGALTGDDRLVDTIEAMTAAGVEVEITPVGPTLAVSVAEPRTVLRALGDMGRVEVDGEWPAPSWNEPSEGVVF